MNQAQVAALAAAAAIQQRQHLMNAQLMSQGMPMMPSPFGGMGIGLPGSIVAQSAVTVTAAPPPTVLYTVDIDINHSNQKHILTRGTFTDQVSRSTGAIVHLRGAFRKIGATNPSKEACLHLHVEAKSEDEMKAAEAAIRSKMGDPPLPAFIYSDLVPLGCAVPYGLDAATDITGPDQSYFNHIQNETKATLILVGRGSLQYQDMADGLVVYIGSKDSKGVEDAGALVKNLLETVRAKCAAYVPPHAPPQMGAHSHMPSHMASYSPDTSHPTYTQNYSQHNNQIQHQHHQHQDPNAPYGMGNQMGDRPPLPAGPAPPAFGPPLPTNGAGNMSMSQPPMPNMMSMMQMMQTGMMKGMSPQAAMAMAHGGSAGMPNMMPGLPNMPLLPSMPGLGGMGGKGGLGGTGGKYNMVAPPQNLMMEHNKIMTENQVDGQGLQVLGEEPRENRHGADYFQRDAPDAYDGAGKRRFRDDDYERDRDSGRSEPSERWDRSRYEARYRERDRDDSERSRGRDWDRDRERGSSSGGGGRRGRLAFTEEEEEEEGGGGGGGGTRDADEELSQRDQHSRRASATADPKASALVIAARLEAKLKAKDAVNPGGSLALPQALPNNFIGPLEPRSAHPADTQPLENADGAPLLEDAEPPQEGFKGFKKPTAIAAAPGGGGGGLGKAAAGGGSATQAGAAAAFALPALPARPPVPTFGPPKKLELTFGGAPLRPSGAPDAALSAQASDSPDTGLPCSEHSSSSSPSTAGAWQGDTLPQHHHHKKQRTGMDM